MDERKPTITLGQIGPIHGYRPTDEQGQALVCKTEMDKAITEQGLLSLGGVREALLKLKETK